MARRQVAGDDREAKRLRLVEDKEAARLRLAKRVAAVVGGIVVLIFCGTGFLGYVYCTSDRPAREVLMDE